MNASKRAVVVGVSALLVAIAAYAATGTGSPQDKVVYHLSDGVAQASNGLRNINNHLEVNPTAKIIVVAHARGVDFLMKGAKDTNGNKYEDLVEQLALRGVQFDVCEITLRSGPWPARREDHARQNGRESGGVVRVERLAKRQHRQRRAEGGQKMQREPGRIRPDDGDAAVPADEGSHRGGETDVEHAGGLARARPARRRMQRF